MTTLCHYFIRLLTRASVLDCGSPLPLSFGHPSGQPPSSGLPPITNYKSSITNFQSPFPGGIKLLYYLFIFALLLANFAPKAHATIGATTPFTSFEAEDGLVGGGATIVSLTSPPTTQFSSPVLEASGHAYVQLTNSGQFVLWTNTTGQSINAINLRSCIPDAPTGGGITSTIDLYVNGTFRQAFSVNSLQNYCYEGTNYNGQTDKNPADGDPRGFWNDTHAFITGNPLAPGDTISFQMDATNSAAFYYIDVVDLESVAAAATQPSNSLSIVAFGAKTNNTAIDNTSAINTCFAQCASQKKIAWIPPGTFYFSAINGGLNANGITIQGAGPWYSTLYRLVPNGNSQGVNNMVTTTGSTLRDVSLDCNSVSRAGNNNNGAINFSGTNWLVTNVWIEHVTSAFWCAGVNGMACSCRILSVWSDGGNFNNVQSDNGIGMNLTYSNNFVRGTGDDAMAINSVNFNVNGNTTNFYTIMSNISYVNNTAIAPWGGKCMGIYGGVNDLVTNNFLHDTARYLGLGVMKFGVNGSPLVSARVLGNLVLRCGGNGYSQQQQAMMIGNGGDGQSVGTIENAYCASNVIINALYDGVGLSTSTNIVFESNVVISPGLDGIVVGAPDLGTGVVGFAVFNYNSVSGLNSGRSAFVNSAPGYVSGGIGNSGFSVPGTVPSPWTSQDIGSVSLAGGQTFSKNTFTLVGSGSGIGGASDSFHFLYQPTNGDCFISAQIATGEILYPGAQTGIMIRDSLDPSAANVALIATPANGLFLQWRAADGGPTSSNLLAGLSAPCWVQLSRAGNTFTPAYSTDGVTWITNSPVTVSMGPTELLGMPVSSGVDGAPNSAMIANVSLIAPPPPFAAIHTQGDLLVNLQSSDLASGSKIWTNRTSNPNSVGNFTTVGNGLLNLSNVAYASGTIKALAINATGNNAVQSTLNSPTEINGASPVSAEVWVFATNVSPTSATLNYGFQSNSRDRDFNYNTGGNGAVSGFFDDTGWTTTPTSNVWHYLVYTYDGATFRAYLDGNLDASGGHNWNTQQTVISVGADIGGTGTKPGNDPFKGFIAAARVESGVLTANDIATNFALGPLASAAALPPLDLTATGGDTQAILTWNNPGNATGYYVRRSTNSSGPYSVVGNNLSTTIFTNNSLANGTIYYFEVSGTNSAGESANAGPVTAQITSLAPPQLGISAATGQLQFTWPQDHTGWLLQMQTNTLSTGLSTNWFTIATSTNTNAFILSIDPAQPNAFFRLTHP